jgi:hypothetical protein
MASIAAVRFLEGHAQQGVVALVAGERVGARDLVPRQRECVARLRLMHS